MGSHLTCRMLGAVAGIREAHTSVKVMFEMLGPFWGSEVPMCVYRLLAIAAAAFVGG